jgi:tetratricopeptide (TPR) repeat protein
VDRNRIIKIDYKEGRKIMADVPKLILQVAIAYKRKDQYDQAISDFNKAIELNPRHAMDYYNRGLVYYSKREFDKCWEDIKKLKGLGYQIPPDFLDNLRKASGSQN